MRESRDRPESLDHNQMFHLGLAMAYINEAREHLKDAGNYLEVLGYKDTAGRAKALSYWTNILCEDLAGDVTIFLSRETP